MKNCKHIRTLLPLFNSEELTIIEQRQVDDHLVTCNRCREELAAIRSLYADLPHANTFEPSEAMLADLRRSLRRRLRQESLRPSWQEKLGSLLFGNLRPIWQLGFSAAILLIGIIIGRQFFLPSPAPEKFDVLTYLLPGKLVAIPSGYVAPSLGDVQTLRFDPATKQVEIHFSMVNDVQLRGSVNDPPSAWRCAEMREPDQPNLRLKAVKALGEPT
jgi:anti-sigma factor RsiW